MIAYPFPRRSTAGRLLLPLLAAALAARPASQDVTQLSIEDLMNVRIVSVSKKEQTLSKTPAAVFVITREDIRHSGAASIPDLLRMVPGVNVAQIDANAWAISIRGFNSRYSNKVLVLIDGRSVYNARFSGVYWDELGLPLEEIERIEVIRGPGGTIWGANAVNGVINIITLDSRDVRGTLLRLGSGSRQTADAFLGHAGTLGSAGAYRAWGRQFNVDSSTFADGARAADGWNGTQAGFRGDLAPSRRDSLMFQGSFSRTGEGQTITETLLSDLPGPSTFNDRIRVRSGHILGRWGRTFSNGSAALFQASHTRFSRYDQGYDNQSVTDFDFQFHLPFGSRHDVVTGAAYRYTAHSFRDGLAATFNPARGSTSLQSAFLQDEIRLSASTALTLGSKFEHNSLTGFEFEPGVQFVWAPDDNRSLWLSAARAIRQPAWADETVTYNLAASTAPSGAVVLATLNGNPDLHAEQLLDYEAGYRTRLSSRLSLELSSFLSFYRRLITIEPRTPFLQTEPFPIVVSPTANDNLGRARDYGGELSANYQITPNWRLSPGYSLLVMKVSVGPRSQIQFSPRNAPKHQAELRSNYNFPHRIEWDTAASYVSAIGIGPVPAYLRLDTRLGWRFSESGSISIAGQNLLTPRHFEYFAAVPLTPTPVQRAIIGNIAWHF